MKRIRHSPEHIIRKLKTADQLLVQGQTVADACRVLEVSQPTYHRWRQLYGGMKAEEAEWFSQLETENARVKTLLQELATWTPVTGRRRVRVLIWPDWAGDSTMKRTRHTAEQIIPKLKTAEQLIAQSKTVIEVFRVIEVTRKTYHLWRQQYGGMQAEEPGRLTQLEKVNARLKKHLAEAELENAMLKDQVEGNF